MISFPNHHSHPPPPSPAGYRLMFQVWVHFSYSLFLCKFYPITLSFLYSELKGLSILSPARSLMHTHPFEDKRSRRPQWGSWFYVFCGWFFFLKAQRHCPLTRLIDCEARLKIIHQRQLSARKGWSSVLFFFNHTRSVPGHGTLQSHRSKELDISGEMCSCISICTAQTLKGSEAVIHTGKSFNCPYSDNTNRVMSI